MKPAPEPIAVWLERRLVSGDGTPIYYRRLRPPAAPTGAVIVVHGMGEHGGRYKPFAEYLSGLGLECFLPDLRCFGRSGGRRGSIRDFSELHDDLAAVHGFVKRSLEDVPIFIFGHSFGGLVCASYLAFRGQADARGLILSSPIFGLASPVPRFKHWAALALSRVLPDFRQRSTVRPSTLTHDASILERYASDPDLYHRISASLYRELVGMMEKRLEIAKRLSLPVLTLQAGEDRVVSKERTLEFFELLRTVNKALEVYPDFYHEVLNEIGRDRVYSRIGQWISERLREGVPNRVP